MGKKKKVADTKLYDIMGVPVDVSQEDLKKAYKRKALQLHPDKRGNSPEAQEEFTRMKTAYDVLSDPQKREIYDTMGAEGLKMVEDFGSMDPEEMTMVFLRSLSATGPKGKCLMLTVLFSIFAFFFLIPVFWCLRIDGTVDWNWAVVFIPVWIFDALVFCCVGFSFTGGPEDDINQDGSIRSKSVKTMIKWTRACKAILFLLQQIFIVLYLNETIRWTFFAIFVPMFTFQAIHLVEKLVAAFVALRIISRAQENSTAGDLPPRYKVCLSICNSTVNTLAVIVFLVLLALKLDGTVNINWWLMFLPIWLIGGFILYGHIYMYIMDKRKHGEYKAKPPTPSHDGCTREDPQEDEPPLTLGGVFCHMIIIGIVLSPFFIACARLSGSKFSAFYILLPFIIVAGLLLCFIGCGVICMREPGNPAEEQPEDASTVKSPPDEEQESETRYSFANDPV